MERDPPLVSPDASRLSQFATQSVTCAMFGEKLYVMPLLFFPCFQKFKQGMALNFDHSVMNFLLGSKELKENIFGTIYTGYSGFKASLDFTGCLDVRQVIFVHSLKHT